MNIAEITSVFGTLFEGIKLVGDLLDERGKRKEVMDLNEHAMKLHELCMRQFEEIQREKSLRVEADDKIKKLLDAKETLARYEAVEVTPLFNVMLPSDRITERGKPVDALCQNCADRHQIGRLNLVEHGGMDIRRGRDALVKCSLCGHETLIQRNVLMAALGR